ncbi:MAG: hypothetical protein AAFZ01_00465 [Pseudomonadota bacterium]
MIKVNLDVTGMFYRRDSITVKDDATVFDVMDAAVKLNPTAGPREALIEFNREAMPEDAKFLNSIKITHRGGSAASRQTLGAAKPRVYPDGVFSAEDEPIIPNAAGYLVPAVRLPDGSLVEDPSKSTVTAWQYYIYDNAFVDKNRAAAKGGQERKIVPFTESKRDYPLENGDTIVWRLVTLVLRQNRGIPSIKGISDMLIS